MSKIKEKLKKIAGAIGKHKAIAIIVGFGALVFLYLFKQNSTGNATTATTATTSQPFYYSGAGVSAGGSGGSTSSTNGDSSTQSITDAINANTTAMGTVLQQITQSNQSVIAATTADTAATAAANKASSGTIAPGGQAYNSVLALLTGAKNSYYSSGTDAGKQAAMSQANQARATAAAAGIDVSSLENDAENAIIAQGGAASQAVKDAKPNDPYITKK